MDIADLQEFQIALIEHTNITDYIPNIHILQLNCIL